eukprot:8584631-Alexandrium_andersonii.AAC.1
MFVCASVEWIIGWAAPHMGWCVGLAAGQGGRQPTRVALPMSGGWPVCVVERVCGFVGAWWARLHAHVCSDWWGGSTQPRGVVLCRR